MSNDPQEWRPSTGLGAVALALFATACVGLSDQQHGVYRDFQFYGWLFGVVACGTLALVHLSAASLRGGLSVWERVLHLAEMHQKLSPADVQPAAAEPVEVAEPVQDDRGWYLAIEITLLAGQVSGFTDTGLTPIMGSDARPRMQRFLAERGVLELRPSGYGWADGVTLADALRRLRMGDLAPYPDGPAPVVQAPVQPATRRDGRNASRKGIIVDNPPQKA